jgi:hypothetical protein
MKELFTFQMPDTQPVELGSNNIHAVITIDQNGHVVKELLSYQDNKGKMITPTMPNRGSGVFAIAGSDVVQYFNPNYPKHYQANIALYKDILEKTGVPEAFALLSFTKFGLIQNLDFSKIKIPKDQKTQKADFNKVRLAFIYAPTGQYLHECSAIVNYWVNLRRNKIRDMAIGQVKCSIMGQLGTPLTDAPADVKFGFINGKLFSCNNDDAVSFGSPKYIGTGVTTETYIELVQRLNYLGNNPNHQIRFGEKILLFWSDGVSVQPLLEALKPLSFGKIIGINNTSLETIEQQLLSLWNDAHSIDELENHNFYATIITSQKTKIELTPVRKTSFVEVIRNIALYHTKQLRFSIHTRPHCIFLDAIYPLAVPTSKTKQYSDRDRVDVFNHVIYGQPLPRSLIARALGRLRVEGIPIVSSKHQIEVSDRMYTQLSFLSLEVPMTEIIELPSLQRQAYALGRLYSYACRQADGVSKTSNHSVRKLWGQINLNPMQGLHQLAKVFPIFIKDRSKAQATFDVLYQAVIKANPGVPERVDLDYGVAFMWGIATTCPKQSNNEFKKSIEVDSQ